MIVFYGIFLCHNTEFLLINLFTRSMLFRNICVIKIIIYSNRSYNRSKPEFTKINAILNIIYHERKRKYWQFVIRKKAYKAFFCNYSVSNGSENNLLIHCVDIIMYIFMSCFLQLNEDNYCITLYVPSSLI